MESKSVRVAETALKADRARKGMGFEYSALRQT